MTQVTQTEFTALMQRLGPFEKNPTIAVGVSGGSDSMALLHLMAECAQAQNGRVIALTVDHGIRVESADEAKQVGVWCASLNIEHVILKWQDPDAAAPALQQRARAARQQLLIDEAARRGILHLALGHQQEDQAETILLRLAKGSGPDGLSGMSMIVHKPQLRLLRPLLNVPRERLSETCRVRGQGWIEDPSNVSPRFARPRLRAVSAALAEEGLTAHHLTLTAAASGRARAALERATAAVLATHARIMPQGYAELILAGWGPVDPELKRRALGQLLQVIGGGAYPPNTTSVDEIMLQLHRRVTFADCLIEPAKDHLIIMREDRNIDLQQILEPGKLMHWNRYDIWAQEACIVSALGSLPDAKTSALPKTVIATQPAFRQGGQVMAVPTIDYFAGPALEGRFRARFTPRIAVGGLDFAIV